MNYPKHQTSKNAKPLFTALSALGYNLTCATFLMVLATPSNAAWKDEDPATAYVDSIHEWGAWELDIEPAAGGLTPPSTGALNARDAKVKVRTNSIAALAPPPPAPAPVVFSTPTTPIVPPVVPVTPPPPPVTPPRPAAPITIAPPAATPPIVVTLPASFR